MFGISINTTAIQADVISWFENALPKVGLTLIIIFFSWLGIKIIVKIVEKFFNKVDFDRTMEVFIEKSVAVVLWIIVGIAVLGSWGVDVGAFIAGLGIAGFVIGFALKDTLGNLASGIFLLVHKPFKIGDFVEVDSISGTVKRIGVAACRINTPDNKKITLQNSAIWSAPIINYTGLKQRRMEFLVGIGYEDDIDKAIKIVKDLIKKDKRFLKEPAPVVAVKELGESSVNIVARPWTKVEDYWGALFDLNKDVKMNFDKNKISIPFPQRDMNIKDPSQILTKKKKK